MGSNRENCHYLKPHKWLSGELCFWRNNPNYSQKTKKKLERLMNKFCQHHVKGVHKFRNEI